LKPRCRRRGIRNWRADGSFGGPRRLHGSQNLTRRANQAHIFIIATIEPARGNRRGLFESGEGCRHISFVPPQFRSPVPWENTQGKRHEESAGCRIGRSVIHFIRGKSAKSCRRCCVGCGVGSGGAGTRRRGGRCGDWIYGGACDRAFLGSGAVRTAITGATSGAIGSRNATASGRRGQRAATRKNSGSRRR
jgi:hypothetical protein